MARRERRRDIVPNGKKGNWKAMFWKLADKKALLALGIPHDVEVVGPGVVAYAAYKDERGKLLCSATKAKRLKRVVLAQAEAMLKDELDQKRLRKAARASES